MPSPYLPNNVHDQGWIDWRLLSEMLGSRTSSMAGVISVVIPCDILSGQVNHLLDFGVNQR